MTTHHVPKLFIASSSSEPAIAVAETLTAHFEHDKKHFEAVLWSHAGFFLSSSTLEDLERFLEEYDYGVFILLPEDKTTKKGRTAKAPRDNVLFELGMFLGCKGRSQTFMVKPKNVEVSLPSDLLGIGGAEYDHPEDPDMDPIDLRTALRNPLQHPAHKIRTSIMQLEKNRKESAKVAIGSTIKEVRASLQQCALDDERIQLVMAGLSNVVKHKAIAMKKTVQDQLDDTLLIAETLLEVLDADQLVKAQTKEEGLEEVWVFAFIPLETTEGLDHAGLRAQVLSNLKQHVRYTYFVESEKGIDRILALANRMVEEHDEGKQKHLETVLGNMTVVVLTRQAFLTYFTIHMIKGQDPLVFESVIREGRKDLLFQLQPEQSQSVVDAIKSLYDTTTESVENGLKVRRATS